MLLCAPPAWAQVPSVAAIRAEIEAKGAKEVVGRLNHTAIDAKGLNDWNLLTAQIWKGTVSYIRDTSIRVAEIRTSALQAVKAACLEELEDAAKH